MPPTVPLNLDPDIFHPDDTRYQSPPPPHHVLLGICADTDTGGGTNRGSHPRKQQATVPGFTKCRYL